MSCCCNSSQTLVITPVPGPQGQPGTAGANGTNGVNAYTTTLAAFVMPAEGATVTVSVANSTWMTLNQIVAVAAGGAFGYFQVIAKPSSTQATLKNIEDTAAGAYTVNSAPGTTFVIGASIAPAGIQGPAGTAAAGVLLAANNLSDVESAAASRSNLGLAIGVNVQAYDATLQSLSTLGTAADKFAYTTGVDTWAEGSITLFGRSLIDDATAGDARATLGLVIGTNVQAYDAGLQSLAALPTVADRIAYSTAADTWAETTLTGFARTILDDADAATMRGTLGINITDNMAMLLYQHQVASGSGGDAFVAGSWTTVPLNTEVVDTGNNGSIAANQITLNAGTYRFRFTALAVASSPATRLVGRLYNVTDAGVIPNTYGSVGYANPPGGNFNIASNGSGRFTLASSKTIRLEAQCTAACTFGQDAGLGVNNIFSSLELWKE